MQLAAGAIGITVAKIREAEVLPGDDVLIAYPVLPPKLPRLRALAAAGRRVTVAVDTVEAARGLGDVEALVEVDIGMGRCGVGSADQFARVAAACARFRGLIYWPSALDEEQVRRGARLIAECLASVGGRAEIVSGGSTPGARFTPLMAGTTEIRPGTYVFNDASCFAQECATVAACALRVLVTVVSTAVASQCVIDGGSKTFSSDVTRAPAPAPVGRGAGQGGAPMASSPIAPGRWSR